MKFLAALFVCCLAVVLPARAQGDFPTDNSAVSRWMTYYYVEKDVAHVSDFLHWLEVNRSIDSKPNFELPVVAFVAALFAENPERVRGWVTATPFTGKTKNAVERALWISHHGELITEALHDTVDYASSEAIPVLTLPLKTPDAFDMMWASFFATGNVEYPARLIDILDDTVPLTGDKTMDFAVRSSAAWSLSSNIRQHELILRMVHQEAARRTGPVQQKLKEMLAKFEAERISLPNCNGEFCAMLALISEDNLKEFDKPSDQGLFLTQLDKARSGDHIAIKLAFVGMELTDDLRADVTYDVKVVAPDGTLYDGAEQKNLDALKRKVPLRFNIFDNRAVMMIRFEPKDAHGTYKVFTEIKDNIGHQTIALSRQIVLTD